MSRSWPGPRRARRPWAEAGRCGHWDMGWGRWGVGRPVRGPESQAKGSDFSPRIRDAMGGFLAQKEVVTFVLQCHPLAAAWGMWGVRLEGPTSSSSAPGHPSHHLTPLPPTQAPLPPQASPGRRPVLAHLSHLCCPPRKSLLLSQLGDSRFAAPPTSHVGSCWVSHTWGWKQNR